MVQTYFQLTTLELPLVLMVGSAPPAAAAPTFLPFLGLDFFLLPCASQFGSIPSALSSESSWAGPTLLVP